MTCCSSCRACVCVFLLHELIYDLFIVSCLATQRVPLGSGPTSLDRPPQSQIPLPDSPWLSGISHTVFSPPPPHPPSPVLTYQTFQSPVLWSRTFLGRLVLGRKFKKFISVIFLITGALLPNRREIRKELFILFFTVRYPFSVISWFEHENRS